MLLTHMRQNTSKFKPVIREVMQKRSETQVQYLSEDSHQFHWAITQQDQTTYFQPVVAHATPAVYRCRLSCVDCTLLSTAKRLSPTLFTPLSLLQTLRIYLLTVKR